MRASADDGHAAAAKPIIFKAYERPTLPAARQLPPAVATQPMLATGGCLAHAAVCCSSSGHNRHDVLCMTGCVHAKLGRLSHCCWCPPGGAPGGAASAAGASPAAAPTEPVLLRRAGGGRWGPAQAAQPPPGPPPPSGAGGAPTHCAPCDSRFRHQHLSLHNVRRHVILLTVNSLRLRPCWLDSCELSS